MTDERKSDEEFFAERGFGMRIGFGERPAVLVIDVINGFTDLVLEVWGDEAGRHARSAFGAETLPFNVPVEIEAIVSLRD